MKFSTLSGCLLVTIPFLATLLLTACKPDFTQECTASMDCPEPLFCRMGVCTDLSPTEPSTETPLGVDASQTSYDDAGVGDDTGPPHPCPDAPPASADNLVLNEFMANVPQGPEGDANQDGERHFHDDEFVELVNRSDKTIDLTDVDILNDDALRFTFPELCLKPLHAVVVFGGIEDRASPPAGEGFKSLVSDTWFRYAQGGGRVVIHDARGETIADHTYESHPPGSLNLNPDLSGNDYIAHPDVAADDDALFSPGTCADGRPFTSGCLDDDDPDSPFADSKPSPED